MSRLLSRGFDLAVGAGLATWFAATALSQHPNRQFDRLRKYDKTSVILPNWRFFAPEPCTHDFRILHRTLNADGSQSPWQETHSIAERRTRQMLWFPQRRRDKGVNDICNEITRYLQEPGLDIALTPAYQVLRDHVALQIAAGGSAAPQGFQFLVATDPGHDEQEETQFVFASRFEEWTTGAHA